MKHVRSRMLGCFSFLVLASMFFNSELQLNNLNGIWNERMGNLLVGQYFCY